MSHSQTFEKDTQAVTNEDINELLLAIGERLREARDKNKNVMIEWSRDVKDISDDTDIWQRIVPDGSMRIVITIPKDE